MITNKRIEKDLVKANEQKSYEGFNTGQIMVMNAFDYTNINYETNELTLYDNIWERDYTDLLDYLKEANIKSITITNASSGLMDFLHFLIANGCIIDTAVEVRKLNKYFGPDTDKGLRIIIK